MAPKGCNATSGATGPTQSKPFESDCDNIKWRRQSRDCVFNKRKVKLHNKQLERPKSVVVTATDNNNEKFKFSEITKSDLQLNNNNMCSKFNKNRHDKLFTQICKKLRKIFRKFLFFFIYVRFKFNL